MSLTFVGRIKKVGQNSSNHSEGDCFTGPSMTVARPPQSSWQRTYSGCETTQNSHPRLKTKPIGSIVLALLVVMSWLLLPAPTRSKPIMPIFEARDPKNPSKRIEYFPHQDEFRFSPYRNEYLSAGWRGGKSVGIIGFSEVSMQCNPGCDGGIIEPDYKLLEDFLEKKFIPAFKPYILGMKKTHFLYRIFMMRGITVLGLSGHHLDKLEQYEFGWMVADEVALMKRELFVRANARVNDNRAKRQRIGYAGVPHYGWTTDTFENTTSPLRHVIHASTYDNPTLSQETIDGLEDSCPANMRRSYIDGYPVAPGGAVHPGFGNRNFIEWPEYDKYFQTGCVIDWSPRRPHVLFFQVLPEGTQIEELRRYLPNGRLQKTSAVIFDEIYAFRETVITTPLLCEYIKAKRYPLTIAIGDPAGKGTEATSGTNSMVQASQSLGLPIRIPPENMIGKIVRVEHVNLAIDPMVGFPTLFIAKHLEEDQHPRGVVSSFRSRSYPKAKDGEAISSIPKKDGISEHAMDCAEYLVAVLLPTRKRLVGPRARARKII